MVRSGRAVCLQKGNVRQCLGMISVLYLDCGVGYIYTCIKIHRTISSVTLKMSGLNGKLYSYPKYDTIFFHFMVCDAIVKSISLLFTDHI